MKTTILATLAFGLAALTAGGQTIRPVADESKATHILTSKDTLRLAYNAGIGTVAVSTNAAGYSVEPAADAPWVTCRKEANGNLTFFAQYHYDAMKPRYATFTLKSDDGTCSHPLVICQRANTSAADLGDKKIAIQNATASSTQSGTEINKSYDDNINTIWHSSWSGASFPINATYTFKEASHIDYLIYTPRLDSRNGRWGMVTVYYATADAPTTFVKACDADCGMNSTSTRIELGDSGLDNVKKIKIDIRSTDGTPLNTFASCAEIGFYATDRSLEEATAGIFTSPLCEALKPGIDSTAVNKIMNPYVRQLALAMLGDYSTEFRVATFSCYEDRNQLRARLKTSSPYDNYENPTGIYFSKGDKVVIFAEGIEEAYTPSLCIYNLSNEKDIETEGQVATYYPLHNGVNVITAANRGNGYLSYYANDYEQAPQIRLHFAMATETGYFDAQRHNDDDWQRLLANAKSDIFDVLSQRLHVAAPTEYLRELCPKNGSRLAEIHNQIVYREHELMGLIQENEEPRNHQFARPVKSGMFADGYGAAAYFSGFKGWINPTDFGFWGLAHELGHNNQIAPGFKWSGCGETTNNIYSTWVQHKVGAADAFGNGKHTLEDEKTGIDDYKGLRGGRFEAYMEQGVRMGKSWQLQDGPDYYGNAFNTKTVNGVDENGNSIGTVTTQSRNFDHFVKVIPFWQIILWSEEVGACPGTMGRLITSYRRGFDTAKFNTNGKQQVEMMKRLCDAAGYNLLPFLTKAGLARPIKQYVEDYSAGWNIITEGMLNDLKAYVESKNYPEPPAALNYINAYNWTRFRDRTPLTDAGLGKGCSAPASNRVRVDNNVWAGAVGYETYNTSGDLIRITVFGLGDNPGATRYTHVLFPASEDASYIMAVGYDGTKVKVYQK